MRPGIITIFMKLQFYMTLCDTLLIMWALCITSIYTQYTNTTRWSIFGDRHHKFTMDWLAREILLFILTIETDGSHQFNKETITHCLCQCTHLGILNFVINMLQYPGLLLTYRMFSQSASLSYRIDVVKNASCVLFASYAVVSSGIRCLFDPMQ